MNLPQASRSLEHFLHAYALAPWRAQRRWIGVVLLLVLGLAMTAASAFFTVRHAGCQSAHTVRQQFVKDLRRRHGAAAAVLRLTNKLDCLAADPRLTPVFFPGDGWEISGGILQWTEVLPMQNLWLASPEEFTTRS